MLRRAVQVAAAKVAAGAPTARATKVNNMTRKVQYSLPCSLSAYLEAMPICLPRSHVYLDTLELQPNSWPRYFVKSQAPAHPVPSPKLLSRPIIEPSPISSLVPQSRPISSSLPRISNHLELRPARSTPTHPSAHPSSPHLSRFQPSLVGNIKRERTFHTMVI